MAAISAAWICFWSAWQYDYISVMDCISVMLEVQVWVRIRELVH